jgi:alpha-1,6-mannosyltransferase
LKEARAGHPVATNAALLLFGVLLVMLARAGVVEYHHYVHGIGEDIFGQIILYLGGIALIERSSTNRWTLGIIFGVALAVRMVCVFAPAFLSSDVYRYVWDGEVQAAGINPYRYIPAAPELTFLRDQEIYPNINRKEYAHTIYPPVAQMIFLAVTRISATETFMKLSMVGFEAVMCVFLLRLLAMLGLPRERILLYAWHPIGFWEVASSGHLDAVAMCFITLALYARLRQKTGATAGWLAAAVLTKLYPLALLPALAEHSRRQILKTIGIMVGIAAFAYLPYLGVGKGVLGFLPSYAQEEGINTGTRFFLLAFINRVLHLSLAPAVYLGCCALALAGLSWWAWRGESAMPASSPAGARRLIFSALVLATGLTLCFSPHYPWYFLWLLPMLTLVPWRPAFYLVMAPTFMLATPLGAPGEPIYRMNVLLYGGFAALLLYGWMEAWLRHRPRTLKARSRVKGGKGAAEQLART